MKVVSALKKYCEHCYLVRKYKKMYIKCKKDPRHKQRQGFSTFCKDIEINQSQEEQIDLNNNIDSEMILRMKIEKLINIL